MKVYQIVSTFLDSNTFVVESKNQHFIIDCGAKIEDVKKIINGKAVSAIFLTHGHYDHCMYALEYAKEFCCKIYANKNIMQTLQDSNKNYGENFSIEDFTNFIFFSGDGEIELNNQKIQYFYCPGHSKCSNCYKIDDELFVGDVLFYQGIGRTDLYGGSKIEMLGSLKKIKGVEFKTAYSGHDKASSKVQQEKNISIFEKFLSR